MISPETISSIFRDCLGEFEKTISDMTPVIVQGTQAIYFFHPERLSAKEEQVSELLSELPKEFEEGWSFLNFCYDRHGTLWTGFHQKCEELMVLGMALEKVEYCQPRDMWPMLPGGMPYVQIKQ